MFLEPRGGKIQLLVAFPHVLILRLIDILRMPTGGQELSQDRRDDVFIDHTELVAHQNVASVASGGVRRCNDFYTGSVMKCDISIGRRCDRAVLDLGSKFRRIRHKFVADILQNVDRLTAVACGDADLRARIEHAAHHAVDSGQERLANQCVTPAAFYPPALCVSAELSICFHPSRVPDTRGEIVFSNEVHSLCVTAASGIAQILASALAFIN